MPGPAGRVGLPSIALLPFKNLSEDPMQSHLAAGLTEELRTLMGRAPHVMVVSSPTLGAIANGNGDSTDPYQTLSARFVLQGSVRRAGNQFRVTARLADTRDSAEIWADAISEDVTVGDLFAIQEKIATRLMAHVASEYGGAMIRVLSHEALNKPTESLTAYEAILRFYHYCHSVSPDAYGPARDGLERAVKATPAYAMAWAALGGIRYLGYAHGLTREGQHVAIEGATDCAQKALTLDPRCEYARLVLGAVCLLARSTPV